MASRPEFEGDYVTWQSVDAVGCEQVFPATNFDRMYVDFAFCHGGRGVVDSASRPVDRIIHLEAPDEWQKEGVPPLHFPRIVFFP